MPVVSQSFHRSGERGDMRGDSRMNDRGDRNGSDQTITTERNTAKVAEICYESKTGSQDLLDIREWVAHEWNE